MLMLSEAGHKEVAAAAAKREREQQRAAAQQLKDGGGSTPAGGGGGGDGPPPAGGETVDGPGVGGAAYVARVARGRTVYRVVAAPEMSVGALKAALAPLCQVCPPSAAQGPAPASKSGSGRAGPVWAGRKRERDREGRLGAVWLRRGGRGTGH